MKSYIHDVSDCKAIIDRVIDSAQLVIDDALKASNLRQIYTVIDWMQGAADALIYGHQFDTGELEELLVYEEQTKQELLNKYYAGTRET